MGLSDAKRKEIETRRELGPRLPRSEPFRRVWADPPAGRPRLKPRQGKAHPTQDSPASG